MIPLNPKGNLSVTSDKPQTTGVLVLLVPAISSKLLLVILWLLLVLLVVVLLILLVLLILSGVNLSLSDDLIYIFRYMVHNMIQKWWIHCSLKPIQCHCQVILIKLWLLEDPKHPMIPGYFTVSQYTVGCTSWIKHMSFESLKLKGNSTNSTH